MEVRSGRIDGKHAQMIPTFVSMADSIAAGGLSKVGSVEFEMDTRVWSRMIETIHTLISVSAWKDANGRRYLHSSKPEHEDERLLLPAGYPETLQHRDRKDQNDDVLHDVDSGIRKPNRFLVEAPSVGDSLVPEEFHWKAEKDTPEQGPKTV
jgi:hypothetical protein